MKLVVKQYFAISFFVAIKDENEKSRKNKGCRKKVYIMHKDKEKIL